MYKNDSTFSNLIKNKREVVEEYKKMHKKQKGFGMKPQTKTSLFLLIFFLVVIGLMVVLLPVVYK